VPRFPLSRFQLPPYINVTDGRTTYDSNTALALRHGASRGTKWLA